jgi:hypothetical protein
LLIVPLKTNLYLLADFTIGCVLVSFPLMAFTKYMPMGTSAMAIDAV